MFPEGLYITTEARNRAASVALFANIGLTVFKMAVGVVSGSVSVLSEGIHSLLDLVSASVAYFTIREAGKPADKAHPYGHGRIETLSSLFESLLLVAAAAFIIREAAGKFVNPEPIRHQWLAMAVLMVSMLVSYWGYRSNIKAARETESRAIELNALHFLSDVVACAGVLAGLVLMAFTGWLMVDPLIALFVAGYILSITWKRIVVAVKELADYELPEADIRLIDEALAPYRSKHIDIHGMRTRRHGVSRHIDFHVLVCGYITVEESHRLCDEMEAAIQKIFKSASINIHVEPCAELKPGCDTGCAKPGRQRRRS